MRPEHLPSGAAASVATGPAGQPLRFMAMVILLWASIRVVMGTSLLSAGASADAMPLAHDDAHAVRPYQPAPPVQLGHYYGVIARPAPVGRSRSLVNVPIVPSVPRAFDRIRSDYSEEEAAARIYAALNAIPVPAAMTSSAVGKPRVSVPVAGGGVSSGGEASEGKWSASAWLFWRDGSGSSLLGSAGQLGGSQAGLRIDRRLVMLPGHIPLLAYARITGALRDPVAPEAAFGLAVRPLKGPVPLMIGVERRVALDRDGRDAFALVGSTGLYPTHIWRGLIAEGYAQAGLVGFSRADAFVDGRFSLAAAFDQKERIRAGISLSGGAQPGVSRLDIGPMLEARLPFGDGGARLLIEWRQRVAGRAAPGSGLSVTLASDF